MMTILSDELNELQPATMEKTNSLHQLYM